MESETSVLVAGLALWDSFFSGKDSFAIFSARRKISIDKSSSGGTCFGRTGRWKIIIGKRPKHHSFLLIYLLLKFYRARFEQLRASCQLGNIFLDGNTDMYFLPLNYLWPSDDGINILTFINFTSSTESTCICVFPTNWSSKETFASITRSSSVMFSCCFIATNGTCWKKWGNITSWRRNFVTVCSWQIQTSWHLQKIRDES